ncbi:HNH endonuclease family protein [Streptomyces sp. KR55]|uniref:HNH endonuclease family protein n=1 Tax=Streptomyces sp. KR55 TaxID=3457425 RepID=UPI003FD01CB8
MEVYDSEQTPWSPAQREAYANDQDSPENLIAVTAASNRSKAGKDPAEWLPPDASYHCAYAATWVGTKLRWGLAADEAELQALLGQAEGCPATSSATSPRPPDRHPVPRLFRLWTAYLEARHTAKQPAQRQGSL